MSICEKPNQHQNHRICPPKRVLQKPQEEKFTEEQRQQFAKDAARLTDELLSKEEKAYFLEKMKNSLAYGSALSQEHVHWC